MEQSARGRVLQRLLLVVIMTGFCQYAQAAATVVWQIGTFDKSSMEFKLHEAPAPKPGAGQAQTDSVYVIGKSKAETDWPAFQPGSSNGVAGYRPHPYAIQFELPSAPRGLYTLKVALLVESPRVPRLELSINGHRALYFQHPVLDYTGGDGSSVFLPNYSADTITADLPTSFLRQGTNELVLTANDDPATRDDSTGSGLYYDALELEQNADAKFSPADIAVEALPTIFYTQKESGLAELVDVDVRHNSPSAGGQAVLTLGGAKYTSKLDPGWDFGEQRVEFAVPEFPKGTQGEVAIRLGGHSRRFPVTLDPAKKWNFFLVPHTHLDVGYTDYQAKVAEAQSRSLDEAMQLIHDHPDFRFSAGWVLVRAAVSGGAHRGTETASLPGGEGQEDFCADGGGEFAHGFSCPRDADSFAVSGFRVPSGTRRRPELRGYHGRPLLLLVVRVGAGRSGPRNTSPPAAITIARRSCCKAACMRKPLSGGKGLTVAEF